ncbi:MAG: FG-GAP repeat protein, partial [Candidatus Giovannonibacteria bacterium GW2011_GWB1_45_9b]
MYSNVNMGNLTATNTLSTLGSFKIGTENYTSFLGNGLDNTAGVLTANCVEITGSAGLCDGDDAAGGGGAFSWTPGFYGATAVNSTTTAIQFQSGLYASSTVRFGNAGVSPFFYDGAVGNLGLGTTSPFARLSVAGNTVLDSNLITFASSSASTLTLDYRAAATSTIPNNQFYAWTIGTSTTATPIFRINTALNGSNATIATTSIKGGFTLDDGAFNYDSFAGVASVDSGILSWIDMPSSTTTARLYNSYSAQIDSTSILTIFATTTTSGNITKGNVGIGTTTPPWTLTVVGGVCITTGSTCPAAEVNGGLRVDTAGTVADDPGDVFDIAERYPASEPLGAGEIVALDSATTSRALVKKAAWGETVIGVVSTRPALAINGSEVILGAQQEGTSTRPLVALSGRVPVKVNLEGGEIRKGDKISLSSVPGVGTRATTSGVTIGIALEDFLGEAELPLGSPASNLPTGQAGTGEVLVFINLG